MLNLLRKFLRPTLREQLEDGVREALKRYTDRRSAPDLRVYVSADLLPTEVDPPLWSRDETEHLRRFASQWAQDNGIFRAGLRVEVILLDTKREFAFVKPVGLEPAEAGSSARGAGGGGRPLVAPEPGAAPAGAGGGASPPGGAAAAGGAVLEVVSSTVLQQPLHVNGEVTLGRRAAEGVLGLEDRYMSGRHARLRAGGGRLSVTDLDSKNRTFVNEQPLPPHQERTLNVGDTVRMGNTILRLARAD
jgi:hypothetical protein